MARETGSVCKKCRREGIKLFLKGTRCDSNACSMKRREGVGPGMHGSKRGKITDYAVHLREKQKVKTYYGVLERQFRKYYQMAERAKGNTGKVLMSLLERRLDNVVYRLKFATSRSAARQLVSHGHILVNGRRVDIASYLVKPGDCIAVKNRPASIKLVKESQEIAASIPGSIPEYLLDNKTEIPSGNVLRAPVADDVSLEVQPQLIVELCSK
ncbi:MAG: 30S ribosomal protein S4 [Thermoguttaceae bacterium]|nr:30S ribosomal protein S4 [Thermoguttaceae bacterium]MBQ2683396.1 30S ribosomal protein S4 [Thermoguttaceae bacterium]MBQ6618871.1 30S ribosomal protein S4 [Thermoguttaceae bacterium]